MDRFDLHRPAVWGQNFTIRQLEVPLSSLQIRMDEMTFWKEGGVRALNMKWDHPFQRFFAQAVLMPPPKRTNFKKSL